MKFSTLILLSLVCASMGGAATAQAQTAATGQSSAPASPRAPSQFTELGPDQMSSPFTKPTVLKLNAIVARSKSVIDQYDGAIPGIRSAVAAGGQPHASPAAKRRAQTDFGQLVAMHQRATAAQVDMKRAEREVRASGEKYNDVILAAMVRFVDDVADELSTERKQLAPKPARR